MGRNHTCGPPSPKCRCSRRIDAPTRRDQSARPLRGCNCLKYGRLGPLTAARTSAPRSDPKIIIAFHGIRQHEVQKTGLCAGIGGTPHLVIFLRTSPILSLNPCETRKRPRDDGCAHRPLLSCPPFSSQSAKSPTLPQRAKSPAIRRNDAISRINGDHGPKYRQIDHC